LPPVLRLIDYKNKRAKTLFIV